MQHFLNLNQVALLLQQNILQKKVYAGEGKIKWYNIGVEKGLKDIILFKDLKYDGTGPLLSYPGKKIQSK